LAKVNDLEKPHSGFYLLVFGGVAGVIPRRGGSGKVVGFEAWGRLPPFLEVIRRYFITPIDIKK
jgi:hypothetical protein